LREEPSSVVSCLDSTLSTSLVSLVSSLGKSLTTSLVSSTGGVTSSSSGTIGCVTELFS